MWGFVLWKILERGFAAQRKSGATTGVQLFVLGMAASEADPELWRELRALLNSDTPDLAVLGGQQVDQAMQTLREDFEAAQQVASAITPVPGGVGPMTITMLLYNTLQAARRWVEN